MLLNMFWNMMEMSENFQQHFFYKLDTLVGNMCFYMIALDI